VFDAGATGNPNLDLLISDNMKYLSRMKLNQSDVINHLNTFSKSEWTPVVTGNKNEEVYGKKLVFPSRIKYLYFSQTVHDDILTNRRKRLEQDYDEALSLRKTIETGKKPRKKYRNSNHFLSTHISYTFPLKGISREEAIDHALQQSITGREGFFALVSNKDFSVHEALRFYREKDCVEKLFNSMKNEIKLRPTRVWKQDEIYGSVLIVFLAQLVISLLRYKHRSLRRVSTKFIMQSLKNFALTILVGENGRKKRVFSNFDWINTLVFCGKDPG
jgi:transposase